MYQKITEVNNLHFLNSMYCIFVNMSYLSLMILKSPAKTVH
jgi:hypothetical protein